MTAVNTETLKALISGHADDGELMDLIMDALESFEAYHQAIYTLELKRELRLRGAMDSETYREEIPHLDQIRTARHNTVIGNVRLLNRLAEQDGLPPFYPGVVSEAHPHRTDLADSILLFVRGVIESRVTGR